MQLNDMSLRDKLKWIPFLFQKGHTSKKGQNGSFSQGQNKKKVKVITRVIHAFQANHKCTALNPSLSS